MYAKGKVSLLVGLAAVVWACGRGQSDQQQQQGRDLSLAPAESVAQLNDQPAAGTQPAQPPAAQPAPAAQPPRTTPPKRSTPPARPKPAPAPMLEEGTTVGLTATDSINSRHNKKGDPVMASAAADVRDPQGRVVIPAGAVFSGTVSDIAPGTPGGGRLVITFNRVGFGGKTYAVQARVDTMATTKQGRGITTGTAAKVGAGAVIGGIAGRLIGGNKTGTAVGAVAGAAAGAGVAHATRDEDIILPAGAMIQITLTAPFELKPVAS
jgi:Glycine zipper 2TM domain